MSTKINNYKTVSNQSQNTQAWEELTDKQGEALRGGADLNSVYGLLTSGGSGQWTSAEIPGILNIQSRSGGVAGTQGQTISGTVSKLCKLSFWFKKKLLHFYD